MNIWIEEERKAYKQFNHKLLDLLYVSAEIPAEIPWERAEYLGEGVLKLTPTDQDILIGAAKAEGRAKALNLLEQWVVGELKKAESPILEILRTGTYAQITQPNPSTSGYGNGLYRMYGPIVKIATDRKRKIFDEEAIPMPTRMEAFREDGSWKEFPRVVIRPPIRKNPRIYFIFRADGKYHTMEDAPEKIDQFFLKGLGKKGLRGTTNCIRVFPKREEQFNLEKDLKANVLTSANST